MAAYERAAVLVRSLHDRLLSDSSRIGLRRTFDILYSDVVKHLADRPDAAQETWMWVQHAKSRTLVELMGLDPELSAVPQNPRCRELLAEEAGLLARLRTMRVVTPAVLGLPPTDDAPALSVRDAAETSRRLRTIWQELAAWMPEYSAVRLADELSSAEVAAALTR